VHLGITVRFLGDNARAEIMPPSTITNCPGTLNLQ